MHCPHCDEVRPVRAIPTGRSKREGGKRLRRRLCLHCGQKFKTIEVWDETFARLERDAAAIRVLRGVQP